MAIKREELKVGERYIKTPEGILVEVTAIGDSALLYKFIDIGDIGEYYSSTLRCLDIFSLAPKPKKKIKLIGYIRGDGHFLEFDSDADLKEWHVHFALKKVSEREIEVEDL